MNGKTQSILLQVGFKEAAAQLRDYDGADDRTAAIKLLTSQYYVLLQELHTEIGIDADDGAFAPRGGGGPRKVTSGGSGGGTWTPPADAIPFTTSSGAAWIDYRPSKTSGSVKPKFPDFKSADGDQSAYIYDQQGNPLTETLALIAAADAMASLVAPM